MEGVNIALINYYARLIKKGKYTIEQVPEEDREKVLIKLEEMKE